MAETNKPRKQLTEEQKTKLREALKKANEVRSKNALVKKAEKLEKAKQLDDRYKAVLGVKDDPPAPSQETQQQEAPPSKPMSKNKTKKILTPASDESSSDSSSDEEYDASPIIAKYKQKYKNKYSSKYANNNPFQYQATPYNDAFLLAKASLQNKVNTELKKTAFNSLFG